MYAGVNTIIMRLNFNTNVWLILILIFSFEAISDEKSIIYKCSGLSQFELIGASGVKEEIKSKDYKFVGGVLHDLNNIECKWQNNIILCESNFLNIRKLSINLKTNEVTDYISGNKGFGVYIENFKGQCK